MIAITESDLPNNLKTVNTTDKSPKKRWEPQSLEIKKQINALKQKVNVWISLIAFLEEWGGIIIASTISWLAFQYYGTNFGTILLYILVVILIGSRQRALECLIHEATHLNLCRNSRINDLLGWTFAALPLGHNVRTERVSHLGGHHKNFWNLELDPDFKRYQAMGLDKLPASSTMELLKLLTRAFVPYVKGVFVTFFLPYGESKLTRVFRASYWCLVITTFLLLSSLLPLFLYWLVPFFSSLVIIRYLGEISEHSALGCTDEFGSTRNNLGWFNENFLHPRGDAYHLVHHLFPKIPFHAMADAHRILLQDSMYRNAGHHCTNLIVKKKNQITTFDEMKNFTNAESKN